MFLVKLTVVLQLRDHPLLQADAGLDTTAYLELARRVIDGNVSLSPGLYFVSPLYIYFTAALLAVADSLTIVRVVQAALGTAAVAFVFVTAQLWFGRSAAWAAGTFAALTGVFTFYETLVLQAALDPFLTAGFLCALALALNRESDRWFLVAGIVLGVGTLNRPNLLIAGVGLAGLLLLRPRRRAAAIFAAGVVVALLPVAMRNVVVAGEWSPVSSHGGLNFYIGNNPHADGTYSGVPGITPNMAGQQEDARRAAQQAAGRALDDGEVSAHFYRRGISWIRSDPAAAAGLFLRKVHYTFNGSHLSLNYSFPFFAHETGALLRFLLIGPWFLIPAGLVGVVAAAPRERRLEYLIWSSFVPLYALSIALFFVSERYRLPLLIPLCIGAGAAVTSVFGILRRSEWRRALIRVGSAAALCVGVSWPLRLDDGRAEARVRMAERLVQRDQYADADRWTERALEQHPTPGVVHFRIGRALFARRRLDDALRHLQEAAQLDPDHSETSYALGQALLDAGRPADAIPHLRRALNADVRPDLAGFDLARALASTGDRAGALQVLESVTPAHGNDAGSWYGLGQLAQQLGAARLAARYYAEAARAAPQASEPRQQLGLMLARLGDFEGAVRELESAVKLGPADAMARLNLAVGYAQLGRRTEAKAQAQEALRLKPDYGRAKELLAVLEK